MCCHQKIESVPKKNSLIKKLAYVRNQHIMDQLGQRYYAAEWPFIHEQWIQVHEPMCIISIQFKYKMLNSVLIPSKQLKLSSGNQDEEYLFVD